MNKKFIWTDNAGKNRSLE